MSFKYIPGNNNDYSGVWEPPGEDDVYIVLGRPNKNQMPCSQNPLKLLKYSGIQELRLSSAPSLDGNALLEQASQLEKRTKELLRKYNLG